MNRISIGMILLLLVSITGCKEFIEPSIHEKQVILLAPANETEGAVYAQSFWWEEVEDALSYRLQVVSPDFTNTARLVLDTLVHSNRFNFTLDPGKYEWRVRAENGSSQTRYTAASFTVYASSITTQQVQLQTPVNNLLTNSGNTTFKWLKLYGATKYRLEVDTNNFADEKVLFLDQTITALEYSLTLTTDKTYQWRVMALNDTASAKWSVIQQLTYDTTPPALVVVSSPTTNSVVSLPVTLNWVATPTAVKYQLYIYKSDQTTLYNSTYPLTLTGTSHSFTGTAGTFGEKVYWEVKATDAAGNTGAVSERRNFTIQ